ncbi:hypothetical protein GGU11DRAFT_688776, partial [Lentinula aff. detonsa]
VKHAAFEEALGIPNERCLTGKGWIPLFCKTYQIRQMQKHGESGSVDPAVAKAEMWRCTAINASYTPEDIWNDDEMGFFWTAPPDRGLAMKAMKGKKLDKK